MTKNSSGNYLPLFCKFMLFALKFYSAGPNHGCDHSDSKRYWALVWPEQPFCKAFAQMPHMKEKHVTH
jgi:hypothetical protein